MRILIFAAAIAVALSTPAYAGCIGGSVGDACIGIPTPSEREVVREHRERPVIVERHRRHSAPVVIEHNHYDEEDE